MRNDLIRSALAVVVFTVLLGLAYPLVMTGIAQVAFPGRADGSFITAGGRVTGSRLLARDVKDSPRYFHPRPSATAPAYDAGATTFANLGPTNPDLAANVAGAARAILRLEAPYNPRLVLGDIPVDAVTTSGSGIDPDISPANAALQSRRIAAVRHLPLARVRQLIHRATDERSLGFLGEPGVNVLELNLALDRETGR